VSRRTPIAAWPLVVLIRAYQVALRPFMGGQCRYTPTCSQYALDAYREHNVFRASWLTVRRLLRCHPFVKGGYDPVPLGEERGSAEGTRSQ